MSNDTDSAATPIGHSFSFAPKPRRKVTYRTTYRACRVKAPCGKPCVLNNNCQHVYHSCNLQNCMQCHGRARFRIGGKR